MPLALQWATSGCREVEMTLPRKFLQTILFFVPSSHRTRCEIEGLECAPHDVNLHRCLTNHVCNITRLSHSRQGGVDFAEVNATLTGPRLGSSIVRPTVAGGLHPVNVTLTSAKPTPPCRLCQAGGEIRRCGTSVTVNLFRIRI